MSYCFLIYSSSIAKDNLASYEFNFATKFFRIVGDRPFGRGDVVEILDYKQKNQNEFRIDVRVLGDPRIKGRRFDQSSRIEIPTLLFLASRIYLSEFSEYDIVEQVNCEVLSFQSVKQDQNKVYAVAVLANNINSKLTCREPTTGSVFEWLMSSKKDLDAVA